MKAIVGNLADHIYHDERSREFLFCKVCGAECSANKGDYWNLPDDYEFKCCGEPMAVARKECTIEIL